MPSDFITSVHVDPRGIFDHVHVSVRGQVVGVLIADRGDGERIKNVLVGNALREAQSRVAELDGLLGEAQELLGVSGHALRAMKRLYEAQKRGESRVAETGWNRPLTAGQLAQFRSLAEAFAVGGDDVGVTPVILALLDEVARLKAAFVPRPVREPSWLEKDFHVLYLATERLVAALDLDREFEPSDLDDVKEQLRRLMPVFEECEVARRMDQQARKGN
jgi:hypothetical protein